MDEELARQRLRYLQLKAKAAAVPVTAPAQTDDSRLSNIAQTAAESAPGQFLKRSLQTLTTGASDALSTVAGDTYGRNGDPTQQDTLDIPQKVLKVAGGDILPAVSQVTGDAVIEAGKAVLPKVAEDAIASGVGTAANAVMQTTPAKAVASGLSQWRQKSPETYATAGELANIALTMAPVVKAAPTGAVSRKVLNNVMSRNRKKELIDMLTPLDVNANDLSIAGDTAASKVFTPNAHLQGVVDEVNTVPGVDPRKSYTQNRNAITKKVDDLRTGIDAKLDGVEPIPLSDVRSEVQAAIARANAAPTMTGDAGQVAERIYTKLDEILAGKAPDGNITPKDLLDSRRELDSWIKSYPGDPFGPTMTATKTATREIRNTLNDVVDRVAPSAGVKNDLASMHKLLLATEDLAPKAVSEGNTKFTRYMQALENASGFKHPVNPQSAYITGRNPVIGMAVGAGALAHSLKRGLGESVLKFNARMDELLAKAVREGAPPAQRMLIIDAMNKDKEQRNATR